MIIPLAPSLPMGSSNQPESSDGPPSNALLFGLAPGGVYLAPDVTTGTGELLPHRFTLTSRRRRNRSMRRFAFCCTFLLVTETGSYPAPCPGEPGLSSDSSWKPAIICPTPNSQPFSIGSVQYLSFPTVHRVAVNLNKLGLFLNTWPR